jgi:Sulfotransferase domain.
VPGKPNFIYIGPDKAGSSWLHEVLLRHPQIFLSPAKDLYFFDRYYDRGIAWYLRQFDDAGPEHLVVGEVCQDYLFHPEAPQRIADSLGSCRMMVTLRDPADRAFSSYLYMLRSGWEPGTFLQALDRQPMLLEHGSYATALERFTERFGRHQIHVAVFDDLVADPQAFVDALTSWLDVRSITLSPALLQARLPAGRARSVLLSRLASGGAAIVRERDGANLVGRVKRSPLVQRALYRPLTTDKPTMSGEERSAVQVALADEVAQLDRVYGLDLARRWGWPIGDS